VLKQQLLLRVKMPLDNLMTFVTHNSLMMIF